MLKFRTMLVAGALSLATIGAAAAQSPADHVALGSILTSDAVAHAFKPATSGPLANISLRGGAMVSPRGAGLAGIDFGVPSISLGNGWHGRLDADAIFKANFGGLDVNFPITFDQLYYSPNAAGGHNVYYGGGVGAVLNGPAFFDGKLILGTEVTRNIGGEVNVHFTEHDTLLTLLARFHM